MANPKLTQLTTPILRRHLASFVEENDNGASGVLGLRICTASGTGAVLVSQVLVHGVVAHVQLVVPPGYPLLPPEVRVKGRLPHLNLDSRRPPDASGYYPLTDVWRCGSKEGWSSGYGLLHALLHVRLFLEGFMQLGGAAGVQEGSGPGSGEGDYEAAAAVLRGMQLELQDPGWESYSTQWPLSQVEQRPRQVEGQKLKGKAPATTAASAAATITATAPAPAEDDGEAAEEGWQRVLSRRSKRGAGAQAAHSGGRKAVSGSASASAAFPPPLPAPPASSVLDVLYKALQPLEARGLLSNADIAVAKHSLGERAPAPSLQRASQELRCWYTGLGHSQALLCLPLNFTVNPKTRRTDYLLPCFDGYLSLAAFEAGVRKTPAGDAFTHVLPLYISEEHYTQGGEWQLAALCSATGLQRLDLMATLFSTSAVMLADGGVPPSERVLAVLVQVCAMLGAAIGYRHASCLLHRQAYALFGVHSCAVGVVAWHSTDMATRRIEALIAPVGVGLSIQSPLILLAPGCPGDAAERQGVPGPQPVLGHRPQRGRVPEGPPAAQQVGHPQPRPLCRTAGGDGPQAALLPGPPPRPDQRGAGTDDGVFCAQRAVGVQGAARGGALAQGRQPHAGLPG